MDTINLDQLETLSEERGFYAGFYTDVSIDAEIQHKQAMKEYVAQTEVFTEAEEKLQQLDEELVFQANILMSANYIALAVDISTSSDPVRLYKAYLSAHDTELGSPDEKELCGSYEDLMQLGTIILGSRE